MDKFAFLTGFLLTVAILTVVEYAEEQKRNHRKEEKHCSDS